MVCVRCYWKRPLHPAEDYGPVQQPLHELASLRPPVRKQPAAVAVEHAALRKEDPTMLRCEPAESRHFIGAGRCAAVLLEMVTPPGPTTVD